MHARTPAVLALVLLFTSGLSACAPTTTAAASAPADPSTQPATPAKPALLINITSGMENLHAVSMALGLAKTAASEGLEVVVFLNVSATVFASTSLASDVKFGDFAPIAQLMRELLASGAKVIVCGHCASVSGVNESSLLPGVQVSKHAEILQSLKPNMVGFSY
jgi:predicted peroxiredoxin